MGDELYGDLANIAESLAVQQLQEKVAQLEKDNDTLRTEVSELTEQLNAVVEEKNTLERNISSLYNTAKIEIDRKAREIQELREQLAKAQR